MDEFKKALDKKIIEDKENVLITVESNQAALIYARWAREWMINHEQQLMKMAESDINEVLKLCAENQRLLTESQRMSNEIATLREALKDIAVNLVVKEDNYMALHMRELAKQALAETEEGK